MEGRSDGVNPLEDGVTPGTDDKTPPVHGIGLRVTNIEGNNLKPRRGGVYTQPTIYRSLMECMKFLNLWS
ncbi:hypothetical protein Hanom_Chr17g01584931 [Helianthus anomalus]